MKTTILIVDDNPKVIDCLLDNLKEEYNVMTASDGGEGLRMAREGSPDLVISDIVMPVMEGTELCRKLKSNRDTSHIPVILLTALTEKENIILGLESGATDYITKPFDIALLKLRIKNILKDRQILRERILKSGEENVDYTPTYSNIIDQRFMENVSTIAEKNISNCEFAMDDFCKELGISRTSFYNKMKALTGKSPNDFFRIFRLNRAHALLAKHQYSIGEISDMVGFSDPKYFSVCFRKHFGTSPSKF